MEKKPCRTCGGKTKSQQASEQQEYYRRQQLKKQQQQRATSTMSVSDYAEEVKKLQSNNG